MRKLVYKRDIWQIIRDIDAAQKRANRFYNVRVEPYKGCKVYDDEVVWIIVG